MTKTIDLAVEMTEIGARVHLFPLLHTPRNPLEDSQVEVTEPPSLKHLTFGPK
jgi:hypothetical protein